MEIILIFRQVQKTVEPVLPVDARILLQRAGESGSFVISEAVLASLRERGLSHGDVRNALARVTSAVPLESGWTVCGPTMDGEDMTVTVAIEAGIVMVI